MRGQDVAVDERDASAPVAKPALALLDGALSSVQAAGKSAFQF